MTKPLSDIVKQSLSEYHISHIREVSSGGDSGERFQLLFKAVAAVGAIILVWVIDAFVGHMFFYERSFVDMFALNIPAPSLYYRSFISLLIIILAVYSYRLSDAAGLDRALKRSSKWFSTTLKSIGAALVAVDEEGNVIFMNQTAQTLIGWELHRAVGSDLKNVCHIIDGKTRKELRLSEHLNRVIKDGVPFAIRDTAMLQAADGRQPYVTGSLTPILDENKRILGAVMVLHDLTDIKQAEEQVLTLATVIEQADDSVIITDVNGINQYVNPGFERITGFTKDEVIGLSINSLRNTQKNSTVYRNLIDILADKEVCRDRFEFTKKNGAMCQLESTNFRITDGHGNVINYVSISRDISKEVELQRQLTQSQKMEALGRLAGGVAHDFNNYLTIINGYSALLLTKADEDDTYYKYVNQINETGERAVMLIKQLLAFSRKDVIAATVVTPNPTIRDMESMLRRLLSKDIHLTLKLDSDVGSVKVDTGQLGQVIMNLVVNAGDALEGGGDIIIETKNVELDPETRDIDLDVRSGAHVVIAVSDSGCGMDRETISHVFEPFYTTKEKGKGTGLGLSIVYGFVKELGGDIRVSSERDVGTTFELFIPVSLKGKSENRGVRLSSDSTVSSGTETILVVDGEEDIRNFIYELISDKGYNVLMAEAGKEALRVADEYNGVIHLLLTDIVIPRMTGFELFEKISASRPEIQALYTTGYVEDGEVQKQVSRIQERLVTKPFVPEKLLLKIRAVLDQVTARPSA